MLHQIPRLYRRPNNVRISSRVTMLPGAPQDSQTWEGCWRSWTFADQLPQRVPIETVHPFGHWLKCSKSDAFGRLVDVFTVAVLTSLAAFGVNTTL